MKIKENKLDLSWENFLLPLFSFTFSVPGDILGTGNNIIHNRGYCFLFV